MKKPIYSEIIYLLSLIIISFSVALLTSVDFGISMIVAPAYILSEALPFLTFGQAEYVIQGILFILLCILLRKVKLVFLVSFITCLIYGLFLDTWRMIIPIFNPTVCPPGSMDLWVRIVFFVLGVVMTSLAVALSFKAYVYPQVYDFFVNAVSKRFNEKIGKIKTIFDVSFLTLSIVMTLLIFKKFVGINFGTIIMTLVNGAIISFFSKLFDKYFYAKPIFTKFARLFEI